MEGDSVWRVHSDARIARRRRRRREMPGRVDGAKDGDSDGAEAMTQARTGGKRQIWEALGGGHGDGD